MRILFVEPFYGGSHRAFADGLAAHSEHDFVLLTLPGGEWRRRMRRGSQELAAMAVELDGEFDAIVATDMLDLPAFLALTRPRFANTPVLLYFHENQFTYPRIRGTKLNSWFGGINYLSARAANAVAFNSEFHRQDFLGALRTLTRQPNNWLVEAAIEEIAAKSMVLPVGLEFGWIDEVEAPGRNPDEPPLVVWNSRWEFDKSPDMFARTMRWLGAEGVPFRLAVCGDPGVNPHPALVGLKEELGERVVHHGFAESREEYATLLRAGDVVVSTSRHEFFGIGMVEAMYAGCVPVAPRGLNYPYLVPKELHDVCLFESEAEFRELLRARLVGRRPTDGERATLREAARRYDWAVVGPEWDEQLRLLARCSFATGGKAGIGPEERF